MEYDVIYALASEIDVLNENNMCGVSCVMSFERTGKIGFNPAGLTLIYFTDKHCYTLESVSWENHNARFRCLLAEVNPVFTTSAGDVDGMLELLKRSVREDAEMCGFKLVSDKITDDDRP